MPFQIPSLGSNAFVIVALDEQFVACTVPAHRELPLELGTGPKFVVWGHPAVHFVDSSGLSGLLVLQLQLICRNACLIGCGLNRAIQAMRKFMRIEPRSRSLTPASLPPCI